MTWLKLKYWQIWYFLRKLIWKEEIPRFAKYVTELPNNLSDDYIYIVGENDFLWFVVLKCPCGCSNIIHLNLLTEASPCWKVEKHSDETISLKPSVWSLKGCGSHYFIRGGKIKWCGE